MYTYIKSSCYMPQMQFSLPIVPQKSWGNFLIKLNMDIVCFLRCPQDQKTVCVYVCIYSSSVQFSRWAVSHSFWPHGLQYARLPCPSPIPKACSNSCPSSQWCHPTISSSIVPFSSCLQSCPASGSFPMSQLFTSGGQSFGVSASASVLPMNIQGWFPSGWTGLISLAWKVLLSE